MINIHMTKAKFAIILLVLTAVLTWTGLWLLSNTDPNKTAARGATVRDYAYAASITPVSPGQNNEVRYRIQIKDRNSGALKANTSFIVLLSRVKPSKNNIGSIAEPPVEISRQTVTSNENGFIGGQFIPHEEGEYHLGVAPSDLTGEAVTIQEREHPEYKGQPSGPTFKIYVK